MDEINCSIELKTMETWLRRMGWLHINWLQFAILILLQGILVYHLMLAEQIILALTMTILNIGETFWVRYCGRQFDKSYARLNLIICKEAFELRRRYGRDI